MKAGDHKAAPLWQQKRETALRRIREITKDHPLTDLETMMLGDYADQCTVERMADGNAAQVKEFRTVVDWLECTGRISPKEHRELLAVVTYKKSNQ
jgi:hypothetical protein